MKHLTSLLILITSFAPAIALATSPTVDAGNAGTHGANLATNSTTTSQQVLKTIKDYGLDQVAYMLAQKLGQKMATASINKATGGASGDKDPNYIKDFGSIMSNIEQQQKDLFTTKLLLSTNPYARNIAKEMLTKGDPLNNFTLGSVLSSGGDWQEVGNNLALAGKDSLLFYSQLGLPQNTPIGAQMLAEKALSKQIENKKVAETLKINSSGFLPSSKCNVRISDYKNSVQSIIQNEQQNSANNTQISQNNNNIYTNNQTANGSYVPDSGTNPEDPMITEVENEPTNQQLTTENEQLSNQITGNSFNTAGNIQGLSEDTAGCIDEMIKNPVATTQTLTNEAGKFGMDMTKNIQGWGQIVAGLFVSLFNGFVEKGLASLNADYGQVKKGNVGGPEQLAAATTTNGTINFANVPVNIVDLRNDLEPSIASTEKNIELIKNIQDALLKVPNRLATLDMLLPGPDFIGLNTRLDKYYDHQTMWLQKNSMMGSDSNRNAYEENILSMLEREYDISRAEMLRDMNDDTRNIPGAGTMRSAINNFQARKQALQKANDDLDTSTEALNNLRQINVDLKKNVDWLRNNNSDFASLPIIVFTNGEWESLTAPEKTLSYDWAKSHAVNPPVNPTDEDKRDLVVATSWSLWENPELFTTAANWPTVKSDGFLDEKNKVRAEFSGIRDIIPSDWEIAKSEQDLQFYTTDVARVDDLIYDADKMRELIWGTTPNGSDGWLSTHPGTMPSDLLAYMIANKATLFKSADVRNALTLPNVLNTTYSWEEDGCHVDGPHDQPPYEAEFPSADTGADHYNNYACYGDFGYTLSGIVYGAHKFDTWIDAASNQYQTQPHIGWPTELYWKSHALKAVPPPVPNPYERGWTVETINGGKGPVGDKGMSRGLFCRLSSVSAVYGRYSGYALDHDAKNMYCSSKWADVSSAEAIGLFIVNQLK